DKAQGRLNDQDMFGFNDLDGDEVIIDVAAGEKEVLSAKDAEMEVSNVKPVTTAGEVVTTAGVSATPIIDSAAPTIGITEDELTLAQGLVGLNSEKPKVVIQETEKSTTVTTVADTRPKAKGIVMQEPSETPSSKLIASFDKPSQDKDKGKGIMVESEKPLKRKDQIAADEEVARNLAAQLQAELEEEERLVRAQQDEEANILWDNMKAMMDADRLLAERLQAREKEELTEVQKARMFVEIMEKRRKHFADLRAQEKRNRPPTKAQNRSQMTTYLKNMGGYKHSQLKGKSYDKIQKLFDKEIKE
ncbi:hypothetical protein Tco_1248512, partial [Tanacetum coccineum]